MRSEAKSVESLCDGGKNIKKCNNYTLFLCVFLAIFAVSCASTIVQIPKDERMGSGLNISAKVSEPNPWQVDKSIITYVEVTVTNDGNEKVATDVVCENGGKSRKARVVVPIYSKRFVYFAFNRNEFYRDFTCRLQNVEFLDWQPLQ